MKAVKTFTCKVCGAKIPGVRKMRIHASDQAAEIDRLKHAMKIAELRLRYASGKLLNNADQINAALNPKS